jgi:uncharacterized membrane protein YvlD (DUF360 family)
VETFGKILLVILGLCAAMLFLGLLSAIPIMFMWNYVMPDVFGLPTITVWQAFWGSILIRFIFSGITTTTRLLPDQS